jgi:hypothetical protein
MINEIFGFDICDSAGLTYAQKNEILHLTLNREHNLGLVSVDDSNIPKDLLSQKCTGPTEETCKNSITRVNRKNAFRFALLNRIARQVSSVFTSKSSPNHP